MAIKIYQGDAHTIEGTVTDADSNAVDISGAGVIEYQISRRGSNESAIVSLTDSDAKVTGNADGTYTIELGSTETNQTPDEYIHAMRVTLSGKTYHVFLQTLEILDSIFEAD